MGEFTCFSQASLSFLKQNKKNNNKSWFEQHRSQYEKYLLRPFQQLVSELAPAMVLIDPFMEVKPAINKTISRIYRDTRFSSDKSLYRDNMWLIFKRPGKNWSTSIPGFYFEIFPDRYRYGMGFYSASSKIMVAFREKIDQNPKAFEKAISFMDSDGRFQLEGDKYKRLIPCAHSKKIDPWYQMKTFYLACNRKPDGLLFSSSLINELLEGFFLATQLYQFLIQIEVK